MGAKRVLGPFGALHGRQTAGLNASKKPLMWPGRRRKAMDMALVPEGHATEGASSTPPVVSGVAPASSKAGVGGLWLHLATFSWSDAAISAVRQHLPQIWVFVLPVS